MKILMCKPKHFAIDYEINAWMDINKGADHCLAMQQWQQLHDTIIACGAEVVLVDPIEGLPDMVFTANAALYYANQVYMARFKCPERQREHHYYTKWFVQAGYHVAEEPQAYFTDDEQYIGPSFEGAGDALFVGDTLFAGHGFRTDKTIFANLQHIMGVKKLLACELVNPCFYHIDTCFCPINDHQAIWHPAAFSQESQQVMQQEAELFAIPAADAQHFAANAVIIGQHAIIPAECPGTADLLQTLGFSVHACPMSEFIKSGGACKCLTLKISQT